MPIKPESYIETNMQYHEGFAIDEYKGEYFITRVKVGKDDNLYARWMYPQVGKDEASKKPIPWKIGLGNKEQATQRLEQLLMHVEGRTEPGKPKEGVHGDDIPF